MLRYEILMLTVPEITQDEAKEVETQISNLMTKSQASLLSFERWGKFTLAYAVQKKDYGVYFLGRFETPHKSTELIEELKHLCAVKFEALIMRFIISSLDARGPLVYQRPHSLEEATTRDIAAGYQREGRDSSYEPRHRGRGFRQSSHDLQQQSVPRLEEEQL